MSSHQNRELLKLKKINILALSEMARLIEDAGNLWNNISLKEREKLSKYFFHRLYVSEREIQAVQPAPILWTLLVGHSGEDRCPPLSCYTLKVAEFGTPVEKAQRLMLA